MLTTIAQQGAAAAAPAYASSESGASSHRSSLDLEIDAAGARFTPWSTFEDAVEEKEYRGVLRVPFLRAVIKLAVVGLFLESISFVVALFSRTHPINLAMSGTFLTLHAFALVISLFARNVQQFPLAAVELLVTAWLCASAVRTIFFAPSRLARLTGADVAVGVDGFSSLFVRAYAVVFAGGLFVPLELRHFGVVLFVVVASLATGEVVMPVRADNAALRSDAFVQVALAAMALFAVHKRCRNERGQFHFRRALLARVLEWRDTKRSEMEAKARASSAEVAASARAKLIRVVMHGVCTHARAARRGSARRRDARARRTRRPLPIRGGDRGALPPGHGGPPTPNSKRTPHAASIAVAFPRPASAPAPQTCGARFLPSARRRS